MPIVTFKNLSLAFGNDKILDDANLVIHSGDRLALAGRNGAGKSTTLKLINGELEPDDGELWREKRLRFVTLPQQLPAVSEEDVYTSVSSAFKSQGATLTEYGSLISREENSEGRAGEISEMQNSFEENDGWNRKHKIEAVLDRLSLPADKPLTELSGGWLKRVSIAQSLVLEPDVWILDEPTNHLDIQGIGWLESVLAQFRGTILFVSHDRKLMEKVSTGIIQLDRGKLTRHDCSYPEFIERREKLLETEAEHNRQFDDKLRKEEAWIRQGIKARRTRNEGRVRALEALREQRRQRIDIRKLKINADAGLQSGKIVKEAIGLDKSLGGKCIVRDLDLIIQRGDRIGLLGDNGCGKSTLLKLLLNELEPDKGKIKTGTRLNVSYFDQTKAQLDQNARAYDFVSDGRDFISVGGRELHIVSYLQNFLFSAEQARAPIRTLSGGEQNRLILARLFALPANLLVMDEPTNDLDVETLELLEDLLIKYEGTVLLVSHDRAFLDNVVSSLLVFEGEGVITEHVGGYSSWQSRKTPVQAKSEPTKTRPNDHTDRKRKKSRALKQQRDLEKITTRIEEQESFIDELNQKTSSPDFFERSQEEQNLLYAEINSAEKELAAMMQEWEDLENEE